MGFDGLLGNSRLKENLRSSIARGHIAHFYLISGPEGSGKKTLARLLAAAMVCKSSDKPCLCCNACRKVLNGTHPDFITVDDPEKKTVSVDLIREARADVYIRPNEADRKIYLFPRAQDMGVPGQNALLKVLEEPPEYGVFLLLCDAPEKLLPTVRSRCTELAMTALNDDILRQELHRLFPEASAEQVAAAIEQSGGYLGQAKVLMSGEPLAPQSLAFAQYYGAHDTLGLQSTLVPMERLKRDQLLPILTQWQQLVQNALLCRSGMSALTPEIRKLGAGRSAAELMDAQAKLAKTIEYLQGNVSPAAVCGYLEWALR